MIKEINTKGLEYLYHEGELYSIVMRGNYHTETISFFTPDSFSQQLGYLPHKKGNIIKPHKHKINRREILYTQEVLIMKKGQVKVNFYKDENNFIGSETVEEGDIILLCGGGHGFEILEDAIMIEVKQGPYMGLDDKMKFEGIEGKQ
jgi:hypothetical protein